MDCANWRDFLVKDAAGQTSGGCPAINNGPFSYSGCNTIASDQTIFDSWYKEQIQLMGVELQYRVALFDTSVNRFKIRGQDHVTNFVEPMPIMAIVSDPTINIQILAGGYFDQTTIELYIHKATFESTFGPGTQPKAGDIFNYSCNVADTYQITFRDESPAPNANAQKYYVWKLTASRYINSKANGVEYDGDTNDHASDGETLDEEANTFYRNKVEGGADPYGGVRTIKTLDDL
jgi:hypothetical protein